jgi:hypothetical protein
MAVKLPNGYEMTTTFFEDFRIAEAFGLDAVKETFNNAFKNWQFNHVYLTELAIVMSNYSIAHYDNNKELSDLYTKLYYEVDQYCMDNLKNSALEFYLRTTD